MGTLKRLSEKNWAGPCATEARQPRQVRKEATAHEYFWVPQVAWPIILWAKVS